jgi:hypothetical protein
MTLRIHQVAAGALTLSAAYVGIWALLAPHAFFDDFPLPGRHWVSLAGAYDEHLVRDVGGLYLALGVLTASAVLRRHADQLRVVGIAWEVFSVPHLAFHVGHLGDLGTGDRIAQSVGLAATVLLAALLVVPVRRTGPEQPALNGGRARPRSD